jgi:hypothetical protein
MTERSFRITLRFIAAGLLLAGLAISQQASLDIEDDGAVSSAHRRHRTKRGRKVVWTRKTGAGKSWYVQFAESPCVEGSTFGSDRTRICTIAPNAAFKSYKYSSAVSPSGPLHDPEIIVEQ